MCSICHTAYNLLSLKLGVHIVISLSSIVYRSKAYLQLFVSYVIPLFFIIFFSCICTALLCFVTHVFWFVNFFCLLQLSIWSSELRMIKSRVLRR